MGVDCSVRRAAALSVHALHHGRRRLQYPRKKMLAITGAARMVRFTAIGALALAFGRRIMEWAQSGVVQGVLIGIIAICVVGSAISVVGWIKRSRTPAQVR